MYSPNYFSIMKIISTSLVIFAIFAASSFAEQPEILTGNQLQQQATWLNDIHDYEIKSKIIFGVSGMNLEFNINHKAMVPDYFFTDHSMPMMEKQFLCNGDSLWTIVPAYSTFFVEPKSTTTIKNVSGDIFGRLMKSPPFPFGILQLLVSPVLEFEYEFTGNDMLELNGTQYQCEIWDIINDPEGNMSDRLWIDTERRILLKLEGSDENSKGLKSRFEFSISSLNIDLGLTPKDFEFNPAPGFKRVQAESKILMSNSLEGKTFADLDFINLSNSKINSAQWRGKIVLLDFWATWCSPCKKSLPHLRKLQADFNQEIIVVGITNEKMTTVKKFFKEDPSTYPILLDVEGKATDQYQVEAYPTLFVLDANGKILDHFVGYQEESVIRKAIESALEKQDS